MAVFLCILLVNVISLTIVAGSAIPTSTSTTDSSSKIVGGFETTIEENPWQAALLLYSALRCGGEIISDRWILSAAHCTIGFSPNDLSVRVGSSFHASNGTVIKVKRTIEHEKYSSSRHDFDYALIELEEPLKFTKSIQAVALPKKDVVVPDGTTCLVSGWGATHNPNESNKQLRAANVPIANQEYCNTQYNGIITDRMICAGYEAGGKDSCQGDSGGPLTCVIDNQRQVIGVVSFGIGCAEPQYPGVYARVSTVRDWIKEKSGL